MEVFDGMEREGMKRGKGPMEGFKSGERREDEDRNGFFIDSLYGDGGTALATRFPPLALFLSSFFKFI